MGDKSTGAYAIGPDKRLKQGNDMGYYSTEFANRKTKRQLLRSVSGKIAFYGGPAYRKAKKMLGLRESASLFDMDSDTLAQLGQAIKEVGNDTRTKID